MRTRDYLAIALRDIGRQFSRSLLTIIALAISTMVVVTMLAISMGGQRAITEQFGSNTALSLITVVPNQTGSMLSPYGSVQEVRTAATKLNDTVVGQLQNIPHVATATPRVGIWELRDFTIHGSAKQFTAQAQGMPFDTQITLKEGAMFVSNDDKNTVIIGEGYAREMGVSPGDLVGRTITITTQKGYRGDGAAIPPATASQQMVEVFTTQETKLQAKIIGIAEGADQNILLLPLGWARRIRTAQYSETTGVKKVDQLDADGYSAVRIMVDSPDNVAAVSNAIKDLGYGQISIKEQVQRIEQITFTMWIVLGLVALIAVIAAALGVANTMLMTVSEQAYSIAVWRSVGARKTVIMRLFLTQAVLLGLIGGVAGMAIGVVLSGGINTYINSLLVSQGMVATTITVLPVWMLVGAAVLTVIFALLAGIYPAYKAAKADPSAALRSN